jgi:hypothetical protein
VARRPAAAGVPPPPRVALRVAQAPQEMSRGPSRPHG